MCAGTQRGFKVCVADEIDEEVYAIMKKTGVFKVEENAAV